MLQTPNTEDQKVCNRNVDDMGEDMGKYEGGLNKGTHGNLSHVFWVGRFAESRRGREGRRGYIIRIDGSLVI